MASKRDQDHFAGKVVWVTGASSGIGQALALEISKTGARLVLSSRNRSKLEEVRASCSDPARHSVVPLDMEDSTGYDAAAREVLTMHGQIDVLIQCAGVGQFARAVEMSSATERKIMETNFFGTVALSKAVLPSMLERRSGHLVVVTSLMGKFGPPYRTAYAASKHALHGYYDSLRAELWREGVMVTLVCPGFVRTNISYNYLDRDGKPWGYLDEDHQRAMSAERCARSIMQGIRKQKFELYVGGKEKLAVYVRRFFPDFFTQQLGRYAFKRDGQPASQDER